MTAGIDSLAVVITSVATLVTAVGGAIIGISNARKLTQVHESTNGKMEELLRVVREASFAAGQKDQKEKGNG
jgi:hypothetical protein